MITNFNTFNPTFKAHFLNKTFVEKKNSNGQYKPLKVSVAEIDYNNEDDFEALRTNSENWKKEHDKNEYGYFYADRIYNIAKREREDLLKYGATNVHIYIMTTQNSNFDKLEPEKVLAESDVIDEDWVEDCFIEYMQVRPKYKFNGVKEDRDIQHIGKVFFNNIVNDIVEKEGVLCPDKISRGFYSGQKYEEDENGFYHIT